MSSRAHRSLEKFEYDCLSLLRFGVRISRDAAVSNPMNVYQRTVTLDAAIEDVFAFHANPGNITAISPRWQPAEILRGGGPAHLGSEFAFCVRFFGLIPITWNGRWREVASPTLLFDEASSWWLPLWEHRHQFRALGPLQTEMTDAVTYALPLGGLGQLLGATVMRVVFAGMFADRHRRTRAYFEGRTAVSKP